MGAESRSRWALYEAKMQNHKSEVLLASEAKEPLQV